MRLQTTSALHCLTTRGCCSTSVSYPFLSCALDNSAIILAVGCCNFSFLRAEERQNVVTLRTVAVKSLGNLSHLSHLRCIESKDVSYLWTHATSKIADTFLQQVGKGVENNIFPKLQQYVYFFNWLDISAGCYLWNYIDICTFNCMYIYIIKHVFSSMNIPSGKRLH